MDLHPGNIVVDESGEVSVIDFGWCLHRSFQLDDDEMEYYKGFLESNFDLRHFRESLVWMGLEDNNFLN